MVVPLIAMMLSRSLVKRVVADANDGLFVRCSGLDRFEGGGVDAGLDGHEQGGRPGCVGAGSLGRVAGAAVPLDASSARGGSVWSGWRRGTGTSSRSH